MQTKDIHDSSKLNLTNPSEIKLRKDYWNIPTGDFLLHHPIAAKWMVNGLFYLGTLNLGIISYVLYRWKDTLSLLPCMVMSIMTIVFSLAMYKQVQIINKNKGLTLSELYKGNK